MCARLLACPLCSRPSFATLDALRTGLLGASTRPLTCPVCNEVVFGIDQLTIHLFGHTIASSGSQSPLETPKLYGVSQDGDSRVPAVHAPQSRCLQKWNVPITDNVALNRNDAGSAGALNLNKAISSLANSQDHLHAHERQDRVGQVEIPADDVSSSVQEPSATVPEKCSTFQVNLDNENLNILEAKELLPAWTENLSHDDYTPTGNACYTNTNRSDQVLKLISESAGSRENVSKCTFAANTMWREHVLVDILSEHCISPATDTEAIQLRNVESKEVNCTEIPEAGLKFSKGGDQSGVSVRALPENEVAEKSATKEKSECCDTCGFYFLDCNILTLHKQLVHKTNAEDGKPRKPETYEEVKSYPCQLCTKIFKMRGSLMIHMRVAHSSYNLDPSSKKADAALAFNNNEYSCPTCGKSFKKEQHVVQHLKTHNGKQWECDVCCKMFTTKYFLKKHKRLHSGEMPYKCNICDKTFTFQQSYHKHRLYHKADKPHACITCGRSFKELSTLHNHERIHTGEKPFACETCGKCFRQRVSYLVHRRIHTGLMPYKCTLCGKSFRYKVSQRTHKCTAQPTQSDFLQTNNQAVSQTSSSADVKCEVANLQEGNLFSQQRHVTDLCIVNGEENKFILIINTQGQHILKRESEVKSNGPANKNKTKHVKVNNSNTLYENVWDSNVSYGSKQSSQMAADQSRGDNLCARNGHDLLSTAMSPLQNESMSQLTKLENLRLSSPADQEIFRETCNGNLKIIPHGLHLNMSSARAEENCNGNTNVTNLLPTINEESFKQLLHNIEQKE